jgi:hypothetical protein
LRLGRLKVACCALALAVACGKEAELGPAPLGPIRLPTGLAVDAQGRLIVASSNADLLYAESTGGTVTVLNAVDPTLLSTSSIHLASVVPVRSFAGDLAFARTEPWGAPVPDAEACGSASDLPIPIDFPLAVFGTRGSNTLNVLFENPTTGQVSCTAPGACSIPVGTGYADPLPVTIACGGGRARAFVGYLTSAGLAAWVGELDLETLTLQNFWVGNGPIRGFAYDRDRDRLYMVGLATGTPTPLRWIDLGNCTPGAAPGAGGCRIGSATFPTLPPGLELRSIAFAHSATPGLARAAGLPLRAYLTARIYDPISAATAGGRTTEFGSLLIVADLVEDAMGGVTPQVVASFPLGLGAQDVRVLPRAPGWATSRRDVVAALTVTDGALWIYDDEGGAPPAAFRQCSTPEACSPVTGAPILGHEPYGLAIDPAVAGATARLWVGSFADSFVTPIDVTLDPQVVATFAGGFHHKISGPTP